MNPTASAASNAAASGSATVAAMRAPMRARAPSSDESARRMRSLSAAGSTLAFRCTPSRNAPRSDPELAKLRVSANGVWRTTQRQRSPTRGVTGASRHTRRVRRKRPSRGFPSTMFTAASKLISAPNRAGTVITSPSSNNRVSAPGAGTSNDCQRHVACPESTRPSISKAMRRGHECRHKSDVTQQNAQLASVHVAAMTHGPDGRAAAASPSNAPASSASAPIMSPRRAPALSCFRC